MAVVEPVAHDRAAVLDADLVAAARDAGVDALSEHAVADDEARSCRATAAATDLVPRDALDRASATVEDDRAVDRVRPIDAQARHARAVDRLLDRALDARLPRVDIRVLELARPREDGLGPAPDLSCQLRRERRDGGRVEAVRLLRAELGLDVFVRVRVLVVVAVIALVVGVVVIAVSAARVRAVPLRAVVLCQRRAARSYCR